MPISADQGTTEHANNIIEEASKESGEKATTTLEQVTEEPKEDGGTGITIPGERDTTEQASNISEEVSQEPGEKAITTLKQTTEEPEEGETTVVTTPADQGATEQAKVVTEEASQQQPSEEPTTTLERATGDAKDDGTTTVSVPVNQVSTVHNTNVEEEISKVPDEKPTTLEQVTEEPVEGGQLQNITGPSETTTKPNSSSLTEQDNLVNSTEPGNSDDTSNTEHPETADDGQGTSTMTTFSPQSSEGEPSRPPESKPTEDVIVSDQERPKTYHLNVKYVIDTDFDEFIDNRLEETTDHLTKQIRQELSIPDSQRIDLSLDYGSVIMDINVTGDQQMDEKKFNRQLSVTDLKGKKYLVRRLKTVAKGSTSVTTTEATTMTTTDTEITTSDTSVWPKELMTNGSTKVMVKKTTTEKPEPTTEQGNIN